MRSRMTCSSWMTDSRAVALGDLEHSVRVHVVPLEDRMLLLVVICKMPDREAETWIWVITNFRSIIT